MKDGTMFVKLNSKLRSVDLAVAMKVCDVDFRFVTRVGFRKVSSSSRRLLCNLQ